MALTTMSVYSASPAESSAPGRCGATTSWPRPRSSGSSRFQYKAFPPAPGMRTYVAMAVRARIAERLAGGRGDPVPLWPWRAPQGLDLVPLRSNLALERDVEHLVHVLDERERDVLAHPRGNLLEVALVAPRGHAPR